MRTAAIVVAAGSGTRFGSRKQFALLGHETVASRSVRLARGVAETVVLVCPSDALEDAHGADLVVEGGATRAESVRCGLAHIDAEVEAIVVHDAARPLASPALFEAVLGALDDADAAVPALAVTDTLKLLRGDDDPMAVATTLPRDLIVAVQTPQAFRAEALRAAHAGGAEGTDDAQLVELAGGRVVVVSGESANRKLTTPEDLDEARRELGLEP